MATRSGIDTFLYLLDDAFRGIGIEESNESQALLTPTTRRNAWRSAVPQHAETLRLSR